MRDGLRIAVMCGFVMVLAGAGTLAARAAAEQAGQPTSPAAGGLDSGRYHACALLPEGGVRCWGYGGNGSLGYANNHTVGDDETPAAAGPVDLGPGRSALALSLGSVHTCALQDDGRVSCWGYGGEGRLGYGNTKTVGRAEAPGSVGAVDIGPGRTATEISAGNGHTCAVLDDGTVSCWGYGRDGRLGYGNMNDVGDDESPGSAGTVKLGAGRTAKAITAGDGHTCAILDDGAVRCWGIPPQIGYGAATPVDKNGRRLPVGDDEAPDTVGPVDLGAGRTAVAITAGDLHTCAILDDGTVRCWGFAGGGRLGYGNANVIGDDEAPGSAGPVGLGAGHTAVSISAGAEHTCAILDDGSVRCWGYGADGRLGYASTTTIGDDETADSVGPVDLGAGRTAAAISAGGDSTCALLDDGSLRCWGNGDNGRLGSCSAATIGDDETPGSVGAVDLGVAGRPGAACKRGAGSPPDNVAPSPVSGGEPPPDGPPSADPDPAEVQLARTRALRRCLRQRSRRNCRRRYGRTPGHVTGVRAHAVSPTRIVVSFRAASGNGSAAPAAHRYLVKQSTSPIRGARDFRRAHTLCHGNCRFANSRVGTVLRLTVNELRPRTTYYYAVAARDNVTPRVGPRSETVAARTGRWRDGRVRG